MNIYNKTKIKRQKSSQKTEDKKPSACLCPQVMEDIVGDMGTTEVRNITALSVTICYELKRTLIIILVFNKRLFFSGEVFQLHELWICNSRWGGLQSPHHQCSWLSGRGNLYANYVIIILHKKLTWNITKPTWNNTALNIIWHLCFQVNEDMVETENVIEVIDSNNNLVCKHW